MTNSHSIDAYAGIKGVSTFLTGTRLDRIALRNFLGEQCNRYFGGFATDDGIVAYSERGMKAAHDKKAAIEAANVKGA